jgi:peptidoglycan/xylan/chitin deacetylase (PgdA/CDA1 family)
LRFYRTPAPLRWIFPSLTWRVFTTEKELFLTFDDGPVPGPTEFVLDVLSEKNVPATFFCIGQNVDKHPQLLKRIAAEGHEIGNHTYNHVNGWKVSTAEYTTNVVACGATLGKQQAPLFRPPYGRITFSEIKLLKDYQIVMWDVLTYDFDSALSPQDCLDGAVRAVRPGSIIVFHDSYKAEKNLTYVLPKFIDDCRNRGYGFARLPRERAL